MACWAWNPQEWKDVHGQQLCLKHWVSKASNTQTVGEGSVGEGKAGSRRLFLRKALGSTSTSPVPHLHQDCLSQQSLGAALYQHSSAIHTHLYKQIQIQLPWQRSSQGLGLLKFVFCNYFSLLCFFSRFYAKLHGWRVKLCLKDLVFLGCATVGTNFKSCDTITILIDRVTFNQPLCV